MTIINFNVSVVLLCLAFGLVCGSCPVKQFRSSSSGLYMCCNLCSPGNFMKEECRLSANDTQCEPCPAGTYNAVANKQPACHKCRTSCQDQEQKLVKACSSTSDNQCECSARHFWDQHVLKCKKCTECKGQKIVSPCGKFKDATCEKCGKGTYLDSENNRCTPCRYCKKGELVEAECSSKQNTRCKKLRLATRCTCPTTPPCTQVKANTQDPVTRAESFKGDVNFTTLAVVTKEMCSVNWVLLVVVSVVLIFIIAVLVLYIWRIKFKKTTKVITKKESSVAKEIIATPDSSLVLKENHFKFSKTSADVTERLGMFLNANKDWKRLAGSLNYSSIHTQNWELVPNEATQKLLQDWQQGPGATVFVLYQHLKKLHRDDAAAVLVPYLTGQAKECETV